jgi:SAM-dependent methyltransferase
MTYEKHNLIGAQSLNLSLLQDLQQKPAPFTPGEPRFWDDPHISQQMLAAHLDPDIDAASRRPDVIERTVAWLTSFMKLQPGDAVLDLGCGPGLYCTRFAQRGLKVTGVDYSRRSIDYATHQAQELGLAIAYRCQDYLALDDPSRYDAAFLIYGDFCVLAPESRTLLLQNIHRALKPGGWFALDVSTRKHRERTGVRNNWYAAESGFWKPGPHLVLEHGFDYPEMSLYLDQYIVIEQDGAVTVYRNWFQDYTVESISAELEAHGFEGQAVWGDLSGTPYTHNSEWIGLAAKRS